jgi:DNA-binding beta-propeller fold protein YncE
MKKSFYARLFSYALLGAYLLSSGVGSVLAAGQYLIADRLLGRVLRYSESGDFLGTLIDDPSFGYGPASLTSAGGGLSSIAFSPDQSQIYLTDRNSNRVVVYNFDGTSATELFQFTSNGTSTIQSPGGVLFSQDGQKIYISNLGLSPLPATDKVAQLTPGGVSAGPDLTGGPLQGRSGMAFDPSGNLLAGNFNLFGADGSVLRFNSVSNQFETFVGPSAALTGVAALLVQGNDLYVASLTGSNISKYDATTGALQAGFGSGGMIPPSATFISPGSVILSADGSTFLTGILVSLQGVNGYGNIQRFDSSGALLGEFAGNTTDANFSTPAGIDGPRPSVVFGFSEVTGIVYTTVVPEPSSVILGLFGVTAIASQLRRVRKPAC